MGLVISGGFCYFSLTCYESENAMNPRLVKSLLVGLLTLAILMTLAITVGTRLAA
jgi:hypothetical protein